MTWKNLDEWKNCSSQSELLDADSNNSKKGRFIFILNLN